MVFGNRDDESGTGVGFTRNAATGEDKPYGDFLVNAQGEDVVAGIRNTENLDDLGKHFPGVKDELLGIFARLEAHYRDMCDTEFTIDQGKLWMLQTRVGKRTGRAALRMAVDMTNQRRRGWKISRDEAVQRITEDHVEQVLHPQFASGDLTVIATGLAASPGAAVGRATSPPTTRRRPRPRARRSSSCATRRRPRTCTACRRPRASSRPAAAWSATPPWSPAAGASRRWSAPRPCASRASPSPPATSPSTRATSSRSTARPARVVLGEAALVASDPPPELDTILGWADAIRHGKNRRRLRLGVRTNADTGADAARARELGAEGIGLCRTEHMFLGEDRLPVVREMILADTEAGEARALEKLLAVQREDFKARARGDGRPAGDRPPARPAAARVPARASRSWPSARRPRASTGEEKDLLAAARSWHEQNPMLGTRGVRLGRGQARPLRHAGAGAGRGRARRGPRPAASRSSRS